MATKNCQSWYSGSRVCFVSLFLICVFKFSLEIMKQARQSLQSVGIRRHSEPCTTRSWLVEYVHPTQIRIMSLDLRSLRFHGVTSRTDTERGNMQFDFDVGRLPRISNRNSSKHICGFDSIRLPALQRGASAGSSGQFQAM